MKHPFPAIPADLEKVARLAVFTFESRVQSGEFEEPDGMQAHTALINIIARALLAERQSSRN